jgi:hypothetical protein
MSTQPPLIAPRPRPRLAWWLGGGLLLFLLLGAGMVLFRFNPSQYGFYPRCALYSTTGLYCPGCGSQRALYYLLHGDLMTALRCNALLVFSLPLLAFIGARCALRWRANRPLPSFVPRPWQLKLLIGVIILFTVLRNIPRAPFNWLTPPRGTDNSFHVSNHRNGRERIRPD